MAKFLTFIFLAFALAGLYAGTAEAGYRGSYDPYYYGGGGTSMYPRNTAYVRGYSMDTYSIGCARCYDRGDSYTPRVKGYSFEDDYSYQYERRNDNYSYYDNYLDYRRRS